MNGIASPLARNGKAGTRTSSAHGGSRRAIRVLLRLPGWSFVGTGVLQSLTLLLGTLVGTMTEDTTTPFREAQQKMAEEKRAVQKERDELGDRMQLIAKAMRHLVTQMQQLIQDHGLKLEVPRDSSQTPGTPDELTTPGQQAAFVSRYIDPMAEFQRLRTDYDRRNQDYLGSQTRYNALVIELGRLDAKSLPRPGLWESFASATARSSQMSTRLPFLVAWLAWTSGLVLISGGCFWLALIERLDHRAILPCANT